MPVPHQVSSFYCGEMVFRRLCKTRTCQRITGMSPLQAYLRCLIDVARGPRTNSLQEDERHLPDHGDVSQVQAAGLHLETGGALQVGHRSSLVQHKSRNRRRVRTSFSD